MERTRQLADEVRAQAESCHDTLHTMIDLAVKIAACQTSLLSGLSDAKHVFGQLEPVTDDSVSLDERRNALQVSSFCYFPLFIFHAETNWKKLPSVEVGPTILA